MVAISFSSVFQNDIICVSATQSENNSESIIMVLYSFSQILSCTVNGHGDLCVCGSVGGDGALY